MSAPVNGATRAAGTTPRPTQRECWRADRARCAGNAWLIEPSLWAIAVHRFGRALADGELPRVLRPVLELVYMLAYATVRLVTGVDLPRQAQVGPGLRIHHFGGVIVNGDVVIGEGVTLRHEVTLGSRVSGGPSPVIGSHVEFGVGVKVLGGVHVGEGASLGAMALVLDDVPAGATAVGIPARVVGEVRTPG